MTKKKYINFFDMFQIYDCPDLIQYRKPTFKQLYEIIINEQKNTNLINESVFKTDLFQKLFNYIINNKNRNLRFNSESLKQYFPIKSKVFKLLSKNYSTHYHKLHIVKANFSNFNDVKDILEEISNCTFKNEEIKIFMKKMENAFGLFTPLINNKEFSILWLDKNKSNILDFKHEFIHYLEWMNGLYRKNININIDLNNNEYFQNQKMFEELFNFNKNDLEYIFNKKEYQTLLNNFLDILEQIKKEYFPNLSGYDFAKKITQDIKRVSDTTFYLNKIKNISYFKKYFNNYSLAMIIGYHCLDYQTTNIKNHIFGRFNKN